MAFVPYDLSSQVAYAFGREITEPTARRIAGRARANIETVIKEGKLDADVDVNVRHRGEDHAVVASVKTRDRKRPENNGREIMSFLEYGFHSSVWGTYPQGEGPWVEGRHPVRDAAYGG